jgi:hypothetical protein
VLPLTSPRFGFCKRYSGDIVPKVIAMMTFTQIFAVPREHSLILLKHSGRGAAKREEWLHEERDAAGRLVARYESWEDLSRRSSGYRKYDPGGRLLSASDRLPG